MLYYLAALDGVFTETGGENDALGIVNQAIELSRRTVESWNVAWIDVINPLDDGLWAGMVRLGLVSAAASILYLAMVSGKEIIDKQSWSELMTLLIWPVVIAFFLGGNGSLLAKTTLLIRDFGYAQVQSVLDVQLGELTYRDAVTRMGISSAAKEALQNLYSECQGLTGQELVECWNQKKERAQSIIEQAEQQANTPLEGLRAFGEALINLAERSSVLSVGQAIFDPGGFLRDNSLPVIRFFLQSLQWAFVNILEAALLLTALFGPVAMGLSLLPLQGRPIFAWLTGFISLIGAQLGYNILVGLVAAVVVRSGGEMVTDIAFAAFLSIFAPTLAILIARGGGLALYNGISNNIKTVLDFASNAIGVASNVAITKLLR